MNIIRVRLATAVTVALECPREAACLCQDYRQITIGAYNTRICLLSRSSNHFYVRTTWGNPVPVQQTFWGDVE